MASPGAPPPLSTQEAVSPHLGVLKNPGELDGAEPDVERVAHRAHQRDGVVHRQVPVRVHAKGADAIAPSDPRRRERYRKRLLGPAPHAFLLYLFTWYSAQAVKAHVQ